MKNKLLSKQLPAFFILIVFFGGFVFPQDKQDNDNKRLREDILTFYESGGEQGLRNFVKTQKDKISNQFIVDFAKMGEKERNEGWLKICEIIAEEKQDEKSLADVYYYIGRYFSFISNNKKAIDFFEKARSIYKKLNDLVWQGNVYIYQGMIYCYLGDYSRALVTYNNALMLFDKAKKPLGQAHVYYLLGDIHFTIGEYSRANVMFEKALLLYKNSDNSLGQGNALKRKGDIYLYVRNYSSAFALYDKALFFYEKEGEFLGQGNIHMGKGDIYFFSGDYLKALKMYEISLHLYEKAKDPIGLGNVYKSKGDIYYHTGYYSRALKMYEKALYFFEKSENPLGQGNVYRSKGWVYSKTNFNSKAIEMYDKAFHFYKKIGTLLGQNNVYLDKGNVYLKTGDNARALEMYENAQEFFTQSGDIEAESYIFIGKAMALAKKGEEDDALDLFEKGIANLEKVREQSAFSEIKRTFMGKVYNLYEKAVMFMLDNTFYEKGFKYAESMRARVFLDRMTEGLVKLDKGLATDLKKKRDYLVAKLSLTGKEMHKVAGEKDEKKLIQLKNHYRKVEREFEELLIKIRLNNPLYASIRYPQPVSVRELQQEVLKKGELLLSYFITPNKLYVFLVSKESFKTVPIKIKKQEIERLIKRYLLAVKENTTREISKYGKILYKRVFRPVEETLPEYQDIIIIPDGELAKIPFESLILDKSKPGHPVFLLEQYRLKYVQSASLLSILRKHYLRDTETQNFVGFGDPVYDYDNFNKGKPEQGTITRSPEQRNVLKGIHSSRYARAGGIMNRLPRSGEEVNSIGQLFKKSAQKLVVHLRARASEDKAKALDMEDFDFIHFACHGLLNDDFQCLVLAQIPGAKEDGYFTLNEIMNCDYNAKLVVLSACLTGSGKIERGEGITGLTRAVMYAGTPTVVASLWKVDDTATKELMIKFYRNMLEKNLDKTEALRRAKLELLKEKKYSSPLFWSAFVMYGE